MPTLHRPDTCVYCTASYFPGGPLSSLRGDTRCRLKGGAGKGLFLRLCWNLVLFLMLCCNFLHGAWAVSASHAQIFGIFSFSRYVGNHNTGRPRGKGWSADRRHGTLSQSSQTQPVSRSFTRLQIILSARSQPRRIGLYLRSCLEHFH